MKLLITTPSLKVPHGGTRILNEWANRLPHEVTLFVNDGDLQCNWFKFSNVKLTSDIYEIPKADCVVIGSPHSSHLQSMAKGKCFIFLQMLEHLFRPDDKDFLKKCNRMYNSPNPIISISKWNIDYLRNEIKRDGTIHYVGNGVNFDDFPIRQYKKDDKIILVEGWECNNDTKDVDHIAPKVAERLKKEGYYIIAYSQLPLKTMPDVPDEYYQMPDLQTMNNLYSRAKILLKASVYDARSTSPMEAFTKGTPTVRAITKGDDDLFNNFNCLRVEYNEDKLYKAAKLLLNNNSLYNKLSDTCISYVKENSWDYWIPKINEILCDQI